MRLGGGCVLAEREMNLPAGFKVSWISGFENALMRTRFCKQTFSSREYGPSLRATKHGQSACASKRAHADATPPSRQGDIRKERM